MTLILYARRCKIDLRDVAVDVRYIRAGEAGNSGDVIERKIDLVGPLDEETVAKLGAIARRCPAHQMLEKADSNRRHGVAARNRLTRNRGKEKP